MMPGMNGVQLCRSVRDQAGAPYTYFILLTALGDPEHRIAGMQAGADDYLAEAVQPRRHGSAIDRRRARHPTPSPA